MELAEALLPPQEREKEYCSTFLGTPCHVMSKSDGIGRTCDTPKTKALIYFKGSSRSDTGREGEGGYQKLTTTSFIRIKYLSFEKRWTFITKGLTNK